MTRRPIFIVLLALVCALTALVLIGRQVLERDRDALYARYGQDRAQGIEEAARAFAGDVAEVGEDLAIAASVLQTSESTQVAERELHAIATIKREYMVMHARTDGVTTRVLALDAPPDVAAVSDRALARVLDDAERTPGRLHVSSALAETGAAAWYRVFARRPPGRGPTVAVAVDMSILLSRIKLQRDSTLRMAVLNAKGEPAPASDRELVDILRTRRTDLIRESTTRTIDGELARRVGLPQTIAVVVRVPLVIDTTESWTLLAVASSPTLEAQEQTLVRRVLVGGGLVLLLLIAAAAYVIHNTSRAASLRERLRHTARLEHLTEKAEKILDHIPSGVLTLSEDRRVTGMNRWFAERVVRDITGRRIEEAFATERAEDVDVVARLVERALDTREPQSLHRARLDLLGPEASLSIHAIPLARGVVDVSVLVVFDDLTQLRRIEDRLLRSEKLVTAGQLAAGIAHEVGTPLNVARGRVELVLSHLGSDHAEAENHRVVIEQIDRVTRLIQQLLDYVRPVPATMQSVDPARTMHIVKDLLAAEASKRAVTLHVDAPATLPPLRADPDQVQQILVNLVLNAIDASPRGGRVELRAASHGATIALEVADRGHGIPREIQAHVFDPFFTTKKRGQGTGLGLWVVAQLVRAHSAEIEVESHPDRGTTIRIAWPVAT